jgi:hypothetical protein
LEITVYAFHNGLYPMLLGVILPELLCIKERDSIRKRECSAFSNVLSLLIGDNAGAINDKKTC